jgi:hypothetical protein
MKNTYIKIGWTANQILINPGVHTILMATKLVAPSVYGQLVDRYLFNFRVDPEALQSRLPVRWLVPRLVKGHGVVSFCLLRLQGVTLWPLPTSMGIDSTSCAYRCAVTDVSGAHPEPSVYILGRSTNIPAVSRLGTALFSGEMKLIHTSIKDTTSHVDVRASHMDGQSLFEAKISKSGSGANSKLFGSLDEFVAFIKGGLSSYTPSKRAGRYSRVDLTEDSNQYEAVNATVIHSELDDAWQDAGLEFDSAFHATGGLYRLKYLGSTSPRAADVMC